MDTRVRSNDNDPNGLFKDATRAPTEEAPAEVLGEAQETPRKARKRLDVVTAALAFAAAGFGVFP